MQTMVVVGPAESREQDLSLIDPLLKTGVPVDIGVDNQVGWLGDDNLVVDYCDSKGRKEGFFLNKDM